MTASRDPIPGDDASRADPGLRPTVSSQQITLPRPHVFALVPRYEEVIQPEFLRMSGKIRLLFGLMMIGLDASGLYDVSMLGFDTSFYRRFMGFNLPLLAGSVLLGLLIWRGDHHLATMRKMTYACAALEVSSSVACIWLFGSASSHMIVFAMLLVLVYRTFFDFKIGLVAFVLTLAGIAAVVALELAGVIPYAPVMLVTPTLTINSKLTMLFTSAVMLGLCFYVANVAVARVLFRDQTIRVLRANLAAAEQGQQGRHTGRTLCDRYRLGSLLGSGGMGEVYRGVHLGTRRPVAVKILHPQFQEDHTLLVRFQREAKITGALGSPHIVKIIDIDRDNELSFIALELLEGRDLSQRIHKGAPLPVAEVARIVTQAASGLQVAHDAGVIHRDLKPENLFLARQEGGEDVVKILDFGISKSLGGQSTAITGEMSLLGTPDFMSPEQAMGVVEKVDHRADIFALGAIAYNALTGLTPFSATSVPAVLLRICDEEPPPLSRLRPDLDGAVEAVITLAMAKRPHERFDSAKALGQAFADAAAGKLPKALRQRAKKAHRGKPSSRDDVQPPVHSELAFRPTDLGDAEPEQEAGPEADA